MKDQEIDTALKTLPRHRAGPDFTKRLLERLDDAGTDRRSQRWRGAARMVLVGLAVAGVVLAVFRWHEHRERLDRARRLEAIRAEYRELEKELRELRSLAAKSNPVIELGGDENIDFVLDLQELVPGRATGQNELRPDPAAHRR